MLKSLVRLFVAVEASSHGAAVLHTRDTSQTVVIPIALEE